MRRPLSPAARQAAAQLRTLFRRPPLPWLDIVTYGGAIVAGLVIAHYLHAWLVSRHG